MQVEYVLYFCKIILLFILFPEGTYPEGGDRGPDKSQVNIGFQRNSGTDHSKKQLDSLGRNASRGRSVRPL